MVSITMSPSWRTRTTYRLAAVRARAGREEAGIRARGQQLPALPGAGVDGEDLVLVQDRRASGRPRSQTGVDAARRQPLVGPGVERVEDDPRPGALPSDRGRRRAAGRPRDQELGPNVAAPGRAWTGTGAGTRAARGFVRSTVTVPLLDRAKAIRRPSGDQMG